MVHSDLVWRVPFDLLGTFWKNGFVCCTCCTFFPWLGTDCSYEAKIIHTGGTEWMIFAMNDFESVEEGVGFFEPV